MRMRKAGFVLGAVAAMACQAASAEVGGVRGHIGTQPAKLYSPHQVEAYLSEEQMQYIRPGFNIRLNSLSNVAPGQKPVVDVTYTDDFDQPLDYLGKVTPGPLSISFIFAVWDPTARQYTALTTRTRSGITSPSADQNGTWNHISLGHSTYTFGTTLPANLNMSKTYTLGIYGRRTMTSIIGKDYYANNINYDFRPDGQPAASTWNVMDVNTTCNNCHDPLSAHGGTRRTTKNCVLCHTPQIANDATTGNTFDFKVMIHKIHMGENLPSVEAGGSYGFGTNVDFSTVAYPQDIRNCINCHQAGKPQSDVWYAYPTRKACGSCHDNIDWETGENHIAGPQADDSACAACHLPEGESEFDVSIKGAHTIPTKSTQLAGIVMEILSVTDTAPGQKPTVRFKLTDKAGEIVDPNTLSRFRFLVGGPTTDYAQYLREDGKPATCAGDGTCTYTFKTLTIPANATGTWTISADYYNTVTIDNHTDTGLSVREAGQNPIFNFTVTDSQPTARRTVVSTVKCNKCHDVLALHGGQRFKVEECNICHNPNETATVEGAEANTSIHLKWMVHKIHTGEELSRDYVIGETSFKEVLYPGDRRNCEACHNAGSYDVPLPEGALPTQTPDDFVTEWRPDSAACLSCHDSVDAAAHAYVNNAPFGEACASCHGEGRDFAVTKVHAR